MTHSRAIGHLWTGVGILLLLLFALGFGSVFTVHETERALILRFGEIIRTGIEPGLHFKVPLIDRVKKFDIRILTLDARPERFLTSEKKNVIVDSFAKWRVVDVETFYKTVRGDPREANRLLDQIIKDELRNEFGKRTIRELVSGDRQEIRRLLLVKLEPVAKRLGIQMVDIRIKRIDLPEEVADAVYKRMRSERAKVAADFRSRGQEEAEKIRAQADRKRTVILAEARRKAEEIRGEGDAQATAIYARAYERNREFFNFYRSLEAYRKAFGDGRDLLILSPDAEFFRYFSAPKP